MATTARDKRRWIQVSGDKALDPRAPPVWCGWSVEKRSVDHYCRITRQRLGKANSSLPLPASSYASEVLRGLAQTSASNDAYPVRAVRLQTLWRRELGSRVIDFLKVRAARRTWA